MLELIAVAILILLNGFFAMSEMSLMTSRKSRLKQMALSSQQANRALRLAESPDVFLSTVQIGITLIGVMNGLFGGDAIGGAIAHQIALFSPMLAPYSATIGKTLAVVLITFATLIIGELVPKRLAIMRSETIASFIAWPMSALARLAAPGVWLLSHSTHLVLKLLGLGNEQAAAVTDEEIRMLLTESHEAGVIDADERNMLNRVMRLADRTADSMMTPRNRIAWLDAADSYANNVAVMREHQFSRYPVYRHNDQDILGVLEIKTLVGTNGQTENSLLNALRAALFVSESTHAMKLLDIFRNEQQSMALVVDEYGEIQGLVTLKDLMGAVIGRWQAIINQDDDGLIVQREDGSLLIDGSLALDELREVLQIETPLNPSDALESSYHTVAGMCIHHFGRIPHVGETLDWAGWRLEIVDLDGARIDKLLVSSLAPSSDHADPNPH